MYSKEPSRSPVGQAEDPLQLNEAFTAENRQHAASVDDLRRLARKGAWKVVAEQTQGYRQDSTKKLEKASWHIVALARLHSFEAAAEELKALGDLTAAEYSSTTPHEKLSQVPFALRLLACEIPAKLGRWKESQDEFYALLDLCRQNAASELPNAEAALQAAHSTLWREREERVVASLFCQHLRLKDYQTALHWLAWLQDRHPDSLELLSTVGCVQLVIGHTPAAATTFQAVAEIVARNPNSSKEDKLLVQRNGGLLLFAENNFAGAAAEFDKMGAADPENVVAANNRSVCRLYNGEVKTSLKMLEGSLWKHPRTMLMETVIANLSSLYELCSPAAGQSAKKKLRAWLAQNAPDDLDQACLN